jgi:secondary thiamine-phosphate synthase enzyme
MEWYQRELVLPARKRGFHLVTDEIVSQIPEIAGIEVGLLHLFILHTSASLTVNENADPTVREDMESHFNVIAPEGAPHYRHVMEGPDDMPAHIKSSLLGAGLLIPIHDGAPRLGTWQGIYLCEHRDAARARHVVATLFGRG